MRKPKTATGRKACINAIIGFTHGDLTPQEGILIAIDSGEDPVIYIPTDSKHLNGYLPLYKGMPFTWYCRWSEIKIIDSAGKQYEFNFME